MKKVLIIFCILTTITILIFFGVIIVPTINPAYQSNEKIKKDILKVVPIGTNFDDVIKFIESKKKWEIEYISCDENYEKPKDWFDVEEKTIVTFFGKYKAIEIAEIFNKNVTIYWDFDKDLKLVDIDISRDVKLKYSTPVSSLRRSSDSIKKYLLKYIPIGTDIEDVKKFVEDNFQKDFSQPKYRDNGNFLVESNMGNYVNLSTANCVIIYWEFDENSKLVDISTGALIIK